MSITVNDYDIHIDLMQIYSYSRVSFKIMMGGNYGFVRIFPEMDLGIWTMDADWIITEIDNHFWGTEMATSKSETTFNSVYLSLSVIEIGIDLVSEPI